MVDAAVVAGLAQFKHSRRLARDGKRSTRIPPLSRSRSRAAAPASFTTLHQKFILPLSQPARALSAASPRTMQPPPLRPTRRARPTRSGARRAVGPSLPAACLAEWAAPCSQARRPRPPTPSSASSYPTGSLAGSSARAGPPFRRSGARRAPAFASSTRRPGARTGSSSFPTSAVAVVVAAVVAGRARAIWTCLATTTPPRSPWPGWRTWRWRRRRSTGALARALAPPPRRAPRPPPHSTGTPPPFPPPRTRSACWSTAPRPASWLARAAATPRRCGRRRARACTSRHQATCPGARWTMTGWSSLAG